MQSYFNLSLKDETKQRMKQSEQREDIFFGFLTACMFRMTKRKENAH